jgi:hypothetical protein
MYNTYNTASYINAYETLGSYCSKVGINESNYVAITITLPHLSHTAQKKRIRETVNSLPYFFIGCFEFTDAKDKANGNHWHGVISRDNLKHIQAVIGAYISKLRRSDTLTGWLWYMALKWELNEYTKWKYQAKVNQLELDFNTPLATEQMKFETETLQEKLENNLPDVTAKLKAEKETAIQIFYSIYRSTIKAFKKQIGSRWMRLIDEVCATDEVNAIYTRPP